jgi:hypothetical protein
MSSENGWKDASGMGLYDSCIKKGHYPVVFVDRATYIMVYCSECKKVWRIKTHANKVYIDAENWENDKVSLPN